MMEWSPFKGDLSRHGENKDYESYAQHLVKIPELIILLMEIF